MNFQGLSRIEKYNFYLDVAFSRASASASRAKDRNRGGKDRLAIGKDIELARLTTVKETLTKKMEQILTSFPMIDELDPFYYQLIKCTLRYDDLKMSLGSIRWSLKKTTDFYRVYSDKLKREKNYKGLAQIRRDFYGRISSVFKQIKKHLDYLEISRKIMRDFPSIKTRIFTVSLFGFPNVGKSTLLSKLTDARPEINAYPFTTKSLNLGYIQEAYKKIQIIDTPGTLNRFDKMNNIEKQAFLSLEHVSSLVVFVFDISGEYPLETQKKLLKKVKKIGRDVILYLSKTDMIDELTKKEFLKEFPDTYTDVKELKKVLLKKFVVVEPKPFPTK